MQKGMIPKAHCHEDRSLGGLDRPRAALPPLLSNSFAF